MNLKYLILYYLYKNKKTLKHFYSSNKIIIIKKNGKRIVKIKLKNFNPVFTGSNARVIIHEPFEIAGSITGKIGGSSKIEFKKGAFLRNIKLIMSYGALVEIGENFFCSNSEITAQGYENESVIIGDNCTVNNNCSIRNTDGHSLISQHNGMLLNPAKKIEIGNNVWISEKSIVLKGSKISDNSFVGFQSLIKKRFEEPNCLLEGIPAKVVKTNVTTQWIN